MLLASDVDGRHDLLDLAGDVPAPRREMFIGVGFAKSVTGGNITKTTVTFSGLAGTIGMQPVYDDGLLHAAFRLAVSARDDDGAVHRRNALRQLPRDGGRHDDAVADAGRRHYDVERDGDVHPTAHDVVDGNVPVVCTPSSGSVFAAGTTTVHCTATDAHGNIGSGSFYVTVTTSGLTLPDDITVEATSGDGAIVAYETTATWTPASDSLFPLGTTMVQCTQGTLSGTFHVTGSTRPHR